MITLIELLNQQTAQQLNLSPEDVYNVIRHKHKAINSHLSQQHTVEDPGFGKWKLRLSSIQRRVRKLEQMKQAYINQMTLPKAKPHTLQAKIETIDRELSEITPLINGTK